jgi:luciferase family oxidoreductase group 1
MQSPPMRTRTEVGERPPRLSVLEGTPIEPGMSGYAAIRQTVDVAQAADESGYHRLWVTEHHAHRRIASSAPAVLCAYLAAQTTNLRIGSGGVMLSNYAPLVIAEQFCTLEALHPGRIDLGIGRASGAPDRSAVYEQALGCTSRSTLDYPQCIDHLMGFMSEGFPVGHPFADIAVAPRVNSVPIYVLGSSENGARLAAERGLPFAFAYHLGVAAPEPVLSEYRASFRPPTTLIEPYVIVTVGVVCADTDAAAHLIALSVGLTEVRRRQGLVQDPPATCQASQPANAAERRAARAILAMSNTIIGSPATIAGKLAKLADRTGADELMVIPIEPDGPGRIRTVRLVAQGYNSCGW